ncbi:MAG TPA: toll/interleukin-1 receptor domain-containing protein [Thermoanaerobaculia bacterium]|jgi:hypothetical protein|nr:toll/interleukin-1 receptor domain-containing protein [Thermoanaerobaculia bacterium]
MAGIFLSYGSPDQAAVETLRDRLKALGVTVWEYRDDMPVGAPIHETVNAAINAATVAVVCFSDQTACRDWITREVDWCFKAIADGDREMQRIEPVWVGPHPENKVPALIEEKHLSVFDLTGGGDARVTKLALQILDDLGDAPRIVQAALFAMTRSQCAELFDGWQAPGHLGDPAYHGLHSLCRMLGMVSPPELFQLLSQRYGDRPEDLAPFQSGKPLIDGVYEVLERINAERIRRRQKPIVVRWVHDELFGEGAKRTAARDLWRSGDTLLIVDSISSFHPAVNDQVQRLPDSVDPERAAVLWIPPYTQILADFDEPLGNTVHAVDPLGDLFRHIDEEPRRAITFDTGTPMAFRLWLLRVLGGIPEAVTPLQGNVAAMNPQVRLTQLLNPMRRSG